MDFISLLIFISILILVVILVVAILPVIQAHFKARSSGVSINLKEAHAISRIPDLPEEFLTTAAELRKLDRNVYLGSLVDYHVAGGDLSRLKDGLEKIKASGKEVSFNTLLLLNLAKKDVQEALDNVDKVYHVEVNGIEENNLSVDYVGNFKIDYQDSFWVIPDLDEIKEHIKEKITLALLSANVEDGNLGDFILKKYLNRSFWREQAHAVILDQKIIID